MLYVGEDCAGMKLFPVFELRSDAFFQRLLVAAGGDGQVQNTGADGIEVDDLLVIFAAALLAAEDLAKLGVDILVLDLAFVRHNGNGRNQTVLDGLPVVHHDLGSLADAVLGDFIVGHVHEQAALL